MRALILFFSLQLLSFALINAQTAEIDSLTEVVKTLPDDTAKVHVLNNLGFAYATVDIEKASLYADSAILLSTQLDWEKGKAIASFTLGVIHYYQGDSQGAIAYAKDALFFCREAKIYLDEISSLNFLSSIYQSINQLDSALYYANQALNLAESIGATTEIGTSSHNIGNIEKAIGNDEEAKKYFLKALKIMQEAGRTYFVGAIYQGLSNVAASNEEALDYANKALAIFEPMGDIQGQAFCYSSIGEIYHDMGMLEESKKVFTKSLALFEQLNHKMGIASNNGNLGLLLTEMEEYQEAYPLLMKSIALAKEIDALDILTTSYSGLAAYYAHQRKADSVNTTIEQLLAIQDTLYTREKADLLAEASAKYQLKEQETAMGMAIEKQKSIRNRIIFIALAAILILAILIQYLRNRQKIQRKEAQLALQLQQVEAQKLKELDELKSSFFANISHEFRTPLTLITGPIQQALASGDTSIQLSYQDGALIERNTQRLHNLVNQLLDLSKLDSGKMSLQVSEGDLLNFLRSYVLSFESMAERKAIDYKTTFPEQLSNAYFDRDKLEKIISNLLSNAFKFTPSGKQIAVSIQEVEGNLQIRIKDSGVGMPAEEASRIFDRFYQVEGTEAHGSGIGLALVNELVQLYRGEICVESAVNKGTTFELTLPISKTAFNDSEIKSKPIDTSSKLSRERIDLIVESVDKITEGDSSQAPVVLVVEDNPDLRQYISNTLRPHYQTILASDGVEGLEVAIAQTPDLIISDVLMPKMNGFQLCEALKEDQRTSHIPIILLTAKAGQEHKIEGLETGADDYLTKPFDHQELLIRTKNLIQQRKQLREKYAGEMVLRPSAVAITSVDEQFLQSVTDTIEANIDNENFSVEELARAVAFSRSQLHRKLKALIDKSPNALIRDFRLIRAKELLEKGAGNVSEVATAVGYNSLSYFTQSFKQAFGVLPKEIRGEGWEMRDEK
jgi:signal transduction histidine kinase/DNA-binding response OmpR family regulator